MELYHKGIFDAELQHQNVIQLMNTAYSDQPGGKFENCSTRCLISVFIESRLAILLNNLLFNDPYSFARYL